jgi:hypothetical protein
MSRVHVCVCGYVDVRSTLPALAEHFVDFLDCVEHANHLNRIERFIESRGPR